MLAADGRVLLAATRCAPHDPASPHDKRDRPAYEAHCGFKKTGRPAEMLVRTPNTRGGELAMKRILLIEDDHSLREEIVNVL